MRKRFKIFILSRCWGQSPRYKTACVLALTLALTAAALLFWLPASATPETLDARSWAARGIIAGALAAALACVATMCITFICPIKNDRMETCLADAGGAAASWPSWEEGVHPKAGPYQRTRRNGTIIGIYARDDTSMCSVAIIHKDTVDYTSHVEPEEAPALALKKADKMAVRRDRKREKWRKRETRRELKTARETAKQDQVREEQSTTMDRLRQATLEQAQGAAQ